MSRSVYLGQFTDENAEAVLSALEDAGIWCWTKSSGAFTRMIFAADWGVRVFVDEERAVEAREIAAGIAADGLP